jgi:hypothetical protein
MATDSQNSKPQIRIKNRYDEVFAVEIDGWCYGISNFPGDISAPLVYRIVKELGTAFREAIEHHYAFDILELANKISYATKYRVDEKEVVFCILAQFPEPAEFDEGGQYVLAQMVDQVERTHGGAIERLRKKWAWERERKQAA